MNNNSHRYIIAVIKNIRDLCEDPEIFLNGSCYLFAIFLQRMLKDGTMVYDGNHVALEVNNRFYDITGEITGNYLSFEEYGNNHKLTFLQGFI